MTRALSICLLLICLFTLAAPQPPHTHHVTLQATIDSGVAVFLSDGTAWEIRRENREKAASWPKGDEIGVYRTDDSEFAFRLVLRPGRADGDIVSARRLTRVRRL